MINLKTVLLFFIISLMLTSVVITEVKATADEDFESLFFGTGAWLGLLIFMILGVVLVSISKYCLVFVLIIAVMMEVEYYNRLDMYGNHIWKMVILLFFALFTCVATLVNRRRG